MQAQLLALYTDRGELHKQRHSETTQYKTPWTTFRCHTFWDHCILLYNNVGFRVRNL